MTFIAGDCLDPKNYPEQKADLILFDPPFLPFKKVYKQARKDTKNKLDPIITPNNYMEWWGKLLTLSKKYLKPSGWFIFKSDSWTSLFTFHSTRFHLKYANEVIWDKGKIGMGRMFRVQHEKLMVFVPQKGSKRYWKFETIMDKKKKTYRNLDGKVVRVKDPPKKWHGGSRGIAFPTVLRIPGFNSGTIGTPKHDHINQTPPELWMKFIDYCCPKDGLVLDLTAGTFSVAKAVRRLNKRKGINRTYWGMELDEKYVKEAKEFFREKLFS